MCWGKKELFSVIRTTCLSPLFYIFNVLHFALEQMQPKTESLEFKGSKILNTWQ